MKQHIIGTGKLILTQGRIAMGLYDQDKVTNLLCKLYKKDNAKEYTLMLVEKKGKNK